ncbi:phospho-N-acetylmuramoyl-pentapeptide-transferase [Patescibacteria group bacterium]|nr:phospho-N-acetylmuramoyl-pentapeptide-transferase [Patescibacteria group bacterium]
MINEIQDPFLVQNVIKVLFLAALAFIVAVAWTPALTHFLYKFKLGKNIREGGAPIYHQLHQAKAGTPVMGGLLVWVTVLLLAIAFFVWSEFSDNFFIAKLNFLTRAETLLPLGALVATALVGLADDILNVFKIGPKGGGMRMIYRLVLYTLVAIFGAWWFYYKLDWDIIHVPGVGDFNIGWWYVPLFIVVLVATSFSVNEADGLDGLAGGILLTCFGAYAVISFMQGKIELAAFCGVIVGALLAFLWFNIHPARFFMGDTGAMSLGTTLGIVAMLTNTALVLPLIALPLVIESVSVLIQIPYKKLTGKKIFLSTPIHHHFEAKGWPETKVTMRFWIIALVSAALGMMIGLIGGG